MPTHIEDVRSFLEEKSVKYLFDAEKEVFIISFAPNVILVRLEENGEFLQFRTLNFYQYRDGKYKEGILQLLCEVNYQRKLVKFGYDKEDGEINACVDIPIEDSNFTSTQFFRSMAALLEALDETRTRVTFLLETGKDPGARPSKLSDRSLENDASTHPSIDSLIKEIMDSSEQENEGNEDQEEDEK
ncbi:MAG: YbjN domain-containing protein [Candidatus Brocadiae bacterium]|nr:YbjN domain-containing protein [Candidatus Brocadiia bacterium]